jgi:hypothetical protein
MNEVGKIHSLDMFLGAFVDVIVRESNSALYCTRIARDRKPLF